MRKFVVAAIAAILSASASPAMAREGDFVAPAQVRALEILPAPPAPDSAAARAELDELRRIQAARTSKEAAKAKADAEDESVFVFRDVFGDRFAREKLPALDALARRVETDARRTIRAAKDGFHRIRPYKVDETLRPVCGISAKDDSYPSGHTTLGYLLALTLIDMAPERRDEIFARADEYGRNRLVCGVHFPSDIVAGRLLAYTIHAILALDPDYRKELVDAKTELRRALGLALAP